MLAFVLALREPSFQPWREGEKYFSKRLAATFDFQIFSLWQIDTIRRKNNPKENFVDHGLSECSTRPDDG